jgi:hypothetical protein
MKALFVVGIIFLIIIIGFALLIIVPRIVGGIGGAASALTSFFRGADGEGISLTTSSSMVKTGEKFTINWDDEDAKSTTDYVISYTCDEDLSVSFDGKKTECDKVVTINGSDTEISVVPTFKAEDDYEDVTYEITAIEGGDEVRSGQVVVTVVNGSPILPGDDEDDTDATDDNEDDSDNDDDTEYDSNDSNVEIRPSTTKPAVTATKGKANLTIVNLRMGRWDEGVFTETNRVEEDEIGGAMFTVVNDGGSSSGSWTLSYTEPTNTKDTRVVSGQPSVPAGAAFDYTIVFPSYGEGMKSTTVTVDSANQVSERNENDNTSTDTIVFAEASSGQSTGGVSHGNGDADLKVTIDAVGRLDSRRFVETNNLDADDEVAVRFLISNIGGESTGSWRFTVKMTGDDSQSYRSASQPSLKPGQVAEYVLGFEGIDNDAEEIEITVEADPSDDVDEERENNNEDSEEVELD